MSRFDRIEQDEIRRLIKKNLPAAAGGGATDHGLLTGLADDDHPQYHNNARGDARYPLIAHVHAGADITSGTVAYARLPTGTTSSTVAIGDHTHTLDGLSDVVITSPVTTQVVAYNGTNWVNTTPTYYQVLTANTSLSSVTTAQLIFPSASDVFAIDAASSWLVEGLVFVQSGTVTHTTSITLAWGGFGAANAGTSEFTAFAGASGSVSRTQDTTWFNIPTGGVIDATSTGALRTVRFSAQFTAVDAGTVTPSITFSAAPTGTNLIRKGSWIRFTRLGLDSYTTNGGWS